MGVADLGHIHIICGKDSCPQVHCNQNFTVLFKYKSSCSVTTSIKVEIVKLQKRIQKSVSAFSNRHRYNSS